MGYDPYAPRTPNSKKDGKPKGQAKPSELPEEVTTRTQGGDEPTISIRLSDGTETGPVPMSTMKAALKTAKGQGPDDELSEAADTTSAAQTVAAGQLRAFIERIERLEEEKKTIADDIKDVYAEAKGTGFDTKAIRTIVRLRKQDQAEREEAAAILDLYMAALGMC